MQRDLLVVNVYVMIITPVSGITSQTGARVFLEAAYCKHPLFNLVVILGHQTCLSISFRRRHLTFFEHLL
jgi:hypothetical protein